MKTLLTIIALLLFPYLHAQDKKNHVLYNTILELHGTDYVLATSENTGKLRTHSKNLLFINMKDGEHTHINFPGDAYIEHIEQVKIDSLGIHRVVVSAQTVNLDDNKGIDWNDPRQVIIFSTDGKERLQTEDSFFAKSKMISYRTGTMVVTGYFDTNSNGKYDYKDKNAVLLYDLKRMKLITQI